MQGGKTMKKIVAFIMFVLMLAGTFSIFVGCNPAGEGHIVDDDKTLNVSLYEAGYGANHFKAIFSQFEDMYSEEGYKVNIVNSNSTILGPVVFPELKLGAKNKIDMYFTGGMTVSNFVDESVKMGFDLAMDLSEIAKKQPINAQGEEETGKSIEGKMNPFIKKYMYYSGPHTEYNNKVFFLPIYSSPSSMLVNTKVLDAYGLSMPLTTNELLNCVNVIAANGNPGKNGLEDVKPIAWGGYNASAYWYTIEDLMAAQYDGVNEFIQWTSLNGFEDPMDAVEVYERKGFQYSLEVMDTLLDLDNAHPGTINMEVADAQHLFITGKAAFMANSAWFQNEMFMDYQQYLADIQMMTMPIISELGVKLGLDGNGGADRAKTDKILSSVVGMIDNEKTDDEIIQSVSSEYGVTLTSDQIKGVRDARLIYYDRGYGEGMVVNSFSEKKDIAELLIRFVASDDAALYIRTYANAISPYIPNTPLPTDNLTPYMQSVINYATRDNVTGINRIYPNDNLRTQTGLLPFVDYLDVEMLIATEKKTGRQIWEECLTRMNDGFWEEKLKDTGIIE